MHFRANRAASQPAIHCATFALNFQIHDLMCQMRFSPFSKPTFIIRPDVFRETRAPELAGALGVFRDVTTTLLAGPGCCLGPGVIPADARCGDPGCRLELRQDKINSQDPGIMMQKAAQSDLSVR